MRIADALNDLLAKPATPVDLEVNGRWAAVRYADGAIGVWSLPDKRRVATIEPGGNAQTSALTMALSPDARTLALLDGEGTATLWDVGTGRLKERFGTGFTEIFFNRRGDRLLAGAYDLMVMADADGKELGTLAAKSIETSLPRTEVDAPDQPLPLGFAPDDVTAVAAGTLSWLTWKPGAPAKITTLDEGGSLSGLSPGGDRLAFAGGLGSEGAVFLWDVVSRKQIGVASVTDDFNALSDVGFDPSGAYILVVSDEPKLLPPHYTHSMASRRLTVFTAPAIQRVWSTAVEEFSGTESTGRQIKRGMHDLIPFNTGSQVLLIREDGGRFTTLNGPNGARCDTKYINQAELLPQGATLKTFVCRGPYAFAVVLGSSVGVHGRQSTLVRWSFGRWRTFVAGTASHGSVTAADLEDGGLDVGHFSRLFPEAGIAPP
ncbi:WD40 repeat domain-containing protein [Actinomadura sp. 6K520]|uniref:WD40 repeat domain-containing protein n=1 Tax=Actinomadura sp. 6K520 TaxID=2530364 RepID=UPI00104984B1|nr:WD40 repeat domain-containing protein [Actinomadura sp. 6K520]TDE36429.1 WD40 repeat domain-containing protein [Actinomadura sp. 6K520]